MKLDKLKKKTEEKSSKKSTSLKEAFEKEKANVIKKTPISHKRTVILRYKSCCGCGCDWINIERVVDYDSPLKDGDNINNVMKGDKQVD